MIKNKSIFTIYVSGECNCLTAEKYIEKYNDWCKEFENYQRAYNEWEVLRDQVNLITKLIDI